MDGRTDGWMDGQTGRRAGQIDGWSGTDGWMDGQMGRRAG